MRDETSNTTWLHAIHDLPEDTLIDLNQAAYQFQEALKKTLILIWT